MNLQGLFSTPAAGPLLRALLVLVLGTWLATHYLEAYARLMLGVIEHALAFWSPQFEVVDLQVVSRGRDTVIEAAMQVRQHVLFYGRVIPAGGIVNTSTLAGHMLVHVVLLATLLTAWPARSFKEWLLRLLAGLPALVALAWLDAPLLMTGSMHALLLEHLAPETLPIARFVLAMQFIENGGRYLLILLVGLALIQLVRRLTPQS